MENTALRRIAVVAGAPIIILFSIWVGIKEVFPDMIEQFTTGWNGIKLYDPTEDMAHDDALTYEDD